MAMNEIRKGKCVKISAGIYEYRGYRMANIGYHHPDHCIWWEAVNIETGCADYHAHTKKRLMEIIDSHEDIQREIKRGMIEYHEEIHEWNRERSIRGL